MKEQKRVEMTMEKKNHFDKLFIDLENERVRQEKCKPYHCNENSYAIHLDVYEMKEWFRIEAELPGFTIDHIDIDYEEDFLTIQATRRRQEEDEKHIIRSERCFGTFKRSFRISNIDQAAVQASFTDGLLILILPKKKI